MREPCGVLFIVLGSLKQFFWYVIPEFKLLECDFRRHGGQDRDFYFHWKPGGELESDEISQFGEVFKGRDDLEDVK